MENRALRNASTIICLPIFCALAGESIEKDLKNLAGTLLNQAKPENKPVVAVLPFIAGRKAPPSAGRGIAEYLAGLLQSNPSIQLVDRTQYAKVMGELGLSPAEPIDESRTLDAGRMLAADYLLTGTLTEAAGQSMINARIAETETGHIIASASIPVESGALGAFTDKLLGEKNHVAASLLRSMVLPGWGQFYASQPVRGVICLGAFLAGGGVSAFFGVKTGKASGDYNDFLDYSATSSGESQLIEEYCGQGCTRQSAGFNPAEYDNFVGAREDSLNDSYRNWRGRTLFAGIITGGIWALNLIDAGIAGAHSRKKFRLYFESNRYKEYEIGIAGTF